MTNQPKFKAGDTVRIREDLEVLISYGSNCFVNSMNPYKGKTAKITSIVDNEYKLDIDDEKWFWTPEMLEPVQPATAQPEPQEWRVVQEEEHIPSFFLQRGKETLYLSDDYDHVEEYASELNTLTARIAELERERDEAYRKGYADATDKAIEILRTP